LGGGGGGGEVAAAVRGGDRAWWVGGSADGDSHHQVKVVVCGGTRGHRSFEGREGRRQVRGEADGDSHKLISQKDIVLPHSQTFVLLKKFVIIMYFNYNIIYYII
jgi:hypothetical protein